MDNAGDLRVLLDSRHGLVLADTPDEERFFHLLRRVAGELDVPVWTWSVTRGLARDGYPPQYGTGDAIRALDFVADLSAPGVFVFVDGHPMLRDPVVLRRLKEAALGARPGQTLLVTAPSHDVPPEIANLAHRWILRPPGRAELESLVKRTLADLEDRDFPVALSDADFVSLVEAVSGLATREAERVIQAAALTDGAIGAADIPAIRTAKAELLAADGILELVEADDWSPVDVGGMQNLDEWLTVRDRARDAAAHLDPPKGVLLTGIPGCGKSLAAKAIARRRGLPLVLLDPARLYGRYVGESEERLARSLDTVESMAPVVLWIDEIEKGFAVGSGDSGTSRRLLGTFLRWMQDRGDGVFLVATANDVSALPPELLRKGRFDEVFFVDLPDAAARAHIFRTHLERRALDPGGFDLARLAAAADGLSGAEIEAAVVGAAYRAVAAERGVRDADVVAEIEATVPLSVARAEEIGALRTWAAGRAVTA